ncbi:hypothetical protein H0X48_04000 [Candidatus Dependentiae bacterium]|nr:hypothetical protein [Candidatus Dependentiae bacterium]
MKNINKKLFIGFFLVVQVFLIFFHIHKQSSFTTLSYQKQKYEKRKNELIDLKQQLKQALYTAQNLSSIKQFALNTLHMKEIKLSQIKAMPT